MKRLEKKRRERDIRDNKVDQKDEIVVLLQRKLISLRSQKAKIRDVTNIALKKIFMRSLIITEISKTTIPEIALSQKTSCNLSNLHINNS